MSLGDFTPGKTVTCKFNTHTAAGTPITLAGTPAISVYKSSTTESTSGVTLTVDYDSRTGLHQVAVDTSADGTFYAAGNDFQIVITAGTVDSISVVGTVVGAFSLSNRSALRPTTADRTLVVDAAGLADANTVKVGPTGSGTAQTARDIGAAVPAATAGAAGGLMIAGSNAATTFASLTCTGTFAISDGMTIGRSTNNQHGLTIYGSGTGTAVVFQGGATGGGLNITGNSVGVSIFSDNGVGLSIGSDAGNAVEFDAANSGYGFSCSGISGGIIATIFGNITGNLSGSVGSVATGGIAAASFAAGAIDNAAIATDAIGSAELAASAVTEIQSGLATSAALATVAGYLDTEVAAILADTTDVKTRLPAALVSGRMDASVGAMAADTLTASALATDAVTEIATGVWDLSAGVETGLTPRQAMRLLAAACAGELSGAATTTITIRNAVADSKSRITATVTADGDRTAITYDLT